jgi:hypothetical protein
MHTCMLPYFAKFGVLLATVATTDHSVFTRNLHSSNNTAETAVFRMSYLIIPVDKNRYLDSSHE